MNCHQPNIHVSLPAYTKGLLVAPYSFQLTGINSETPAKLSNSHHFETIPSTEHTLIKHRAANCLMHDYLMLYKRLKITKSKYTIFIPLRKIWLVSPPTSKQVSYSSVYLTRLLSIRKSLACARISKLTTNMYIARARCEIQPAMGSSGLNIRWS